MERLALISGLIGALVSAALSFIVRRVLDARVQREAERKLAYVLLVRTSALLATETVIRAFMEEMLTTPSAREAFATSDAKYNASHRVSAILAFILNLLPAEGLIKNSQFRMFPRYIALLLEDARESRLSPEQLAKLPREAILAFGNFQAEHAQMCQVASLWRDYFEHGERFWVTAEVLHGQWRALRRFMESARAVRTILVKHEAATLSEADRLLASQISTLKLGVMTGLSDKPKLAAAASQLLSVVSRSDDVGSSPSPKG